MAVISKIRSYSGLLIAVIGIALVAFVLGDFFGYGPMGGQSFDVGKVDKTKISFQEFEQRVNDRLEGWKMETGNQNPGPAETFQLRQQVWTSMVREILLNKELDILGVDVSADELFHLIHGPNPHPIIVRNFSNPADGSFDPEQVLNFLRNFDALDDNTRNQWMLIEQYIKRERQENKYHTLIRQGFYMPAALLKMDFQDRNALVDIRYMAKTFESIADSLVQVSERDLRRVYQSHRKTFDREASRSLHYVVFPVFASESDRENLRQELIDLIPEFMSAENMQTFINSVSDERFNPMYLSQGQLSAELDSAMFNSPVGTIYGPIVEGNAFVLAKLTDIQFRPDSMRAGHILISYIGSAAASQTTTRTIDQARALADSLVTVARRNPGGFGDLAVQYSDDPSAQMNRGDIEWFRDFEMVPEFSEAVIAANTNSFTTAETQFGIHVIHVTGKSAPSKKVQVARLTRNIEPSNRTFQSVFAQASQFVNLLRANKNFEEAVDEQGLSLRVVEMLREMDMSLPGIDNPREIIRWAFDPKTKVGSTSRIFDIDNRFIIASLTGKAEKGIQPLEKVRQEVTALALREKKFEMLATEMTQALSAGSFESVASRMGLVPEQALEMRFTMLNLPNFGAEPRVIGAAFGLKPNTISVPVKGNRGAFLVEVINHEPAIEPDNFNSNHRQLKNSFSNRVINEVFNAIRNNARIEDNRSLFF